MRIIERFTESKLSRENTCEDGYVLTPDYAVVIDGASAKSNMKIDGVSTGRFIMEVIRQIVPTLTSEHTAVSFIRELESELQQYYMKYDLLDKFKEDINTIPNASIAVYSKHQSQIWLFGDAQALVDSVAITNTKAVDDLTSIVRRYVNEYHLARGVTVEELVENDLGRDFIAPLLFMQQSFHNTDRDSPFYYSCVDGFDFDENKIVIYDISHSTKEIILASDGYPILHPTLSETENYLAQMNDIDQLAIKENMGVKGKYKGLKSYDDRCYLRLEVNN